jgi:streptogramin lyase
VAANPFRTRVLWKSPGPMPNGLQATPEGLWVCDQVDPNRIFLLDWETGDSLREIPTRSLHGSGITRDPQGRLWIASTFGYELIAYDAESGRELVAYPTPPYDRSGGPHGIEWRDGALWFNVPAARAIYRMDPDSGEILGSIPVPGDRSHGMAFQDGTIWLADTNRCVLFQLDPADGRILDAIGVVGPEAHGMTIRDGTFWLCDATTREVFVLERAPA